MFGLERDQQAEDEETRTTTTLRVLKDRVTGRATGKTFHYGFDQERGRLIPKDAADLKGDTEFPADGDPF
jgi:twinkle protein